MPPLQLTGRHRIATAHYTVAPAVHISPLTATMPEQMNVNVSSSGDAAATETASQPLTHVIASAWDNSNTIE